MTKTDFLASMNTHGAVLLPKTSDRALILTQNSLQQMRCAIIPPDIIDLFLHDADGLILGDANIFGVATHTRPTYEIPGIVQVNRDVNGIPSMRGRTIIGRNGLFWFCFDAYGSGYMLDILTLAPVRKYDNVFRAMTDCLAVGGI